MDQAFVDIIGQSTYLLKTMGRRKEAEELYRHGVDFMDQMAAQFPSVPGYRARLGYSYANLGLLLKDLGEYKEAETIHHEAIHILEKLVEEFPDKPDYLRELSLNYRRLSSVLRATDRAAEAVDYVRKDIQIAEKLVRQFPLVPEYRVTLIGSQETIAAMLLNEHPEEAIQLFRAAIASREELVAEFPAVKGYWEQLMGGYRDVVRRLEDAGQTSAAEIVYHDAIARFEKLTERMHNIERFWLLRASIYMALRQPDKAVADYSKAIELGPNSVHNAWTYLERANAYRALKQKELALSDFSTAIERWPDLWDAWRRRASFHYECQHWKQAVADYSKAGAKTCSLFVTSIMCVSGLSSAGRRTCRARPLLSTQNLPCPIPSSR